MNIKRIFCVLVFVTLFSFLGMDFVHAQNTGINGTASVGARVGGPGFFSKIQNVIDFIKTLAAGNLAGVIAAQWYAWLYPLVIALGLLSIISAGYTYMTSQGNPEKVQDASSKLTASILGIVFIVLSLVILQVIMKTLL